MSAIRDFIKQSLYSAGYYHFVARAKSGGEPRLLVLFYHSIRGGSNACESSLFDVSSPTDSHFEAHLREITKYYPVVELETGVEQVNSGTLSRDSVAITFDDGFESVYTTAYPLLRAYGVPATVFLFTEWINTGRPFWWSTLKELVRQSEFRGVGPAAIEDTLGMSCGVSFGPEPPSAAARRRLLAAVEPQLQSLADEDRAERIDRLSPVLFPSGGFAPEAESPLNWDQISEMAEDGVRIQSHTCSHLNIRHAHPSVVESEIVESKRQIENRLQREVTGFAYPYGKDIEAYTAVHPLLKNLGFHYACTTCPGIVSADTNPYMLGRSALPLSSNRALIHRALLLLFARPGLQASA